MTHQTIDLDEMEAGVGLSEEATLSHYTNVSAERHSEASHARITRSQISQRGADCMVEKWGWRSTGGGVPRAGFPTGQRHCHCLPSEPKISGMTHGLYDYQATHDQRNRI